MVYHLMFVYCMTFVWRKPFVRLSVVIVLGLGIRLDTLWSVGAKYLLRSHKGFVGDALVRGVYESHVAFVKCQRVELPVLLAAVHVGVFLNSA